MLLLEMLMWRNPAERRKHGMCPVYTSIVANSSFMGFGSDILIVIHLGHE